MNSKQHCPSMAASQMVPATVGNAPSASRMVVARGGSSSPPASLVLGPPAVVRSATTTAATNRSSPAGAAAAKGGMSNSNYNNYHNNNNNTLGAAAAAAAATARRMSMPAAIRGSNGTTAIGMPPGTGGAYPRMGAISYHPHHHHPGMGISSMAMTPRGMAFRGAAPNAAMHYATYHPEVGEQEATMMMARRGPMTGAMPPSQRVHMARDSVGAEEPGMVDYYQGHTMPRSHHPHTAMMMDRRHSTIGITSSAGMSPPMTGEGGLQARYYHRNPIMMMTSAGGATTGASPVPGTRRRSMGQPLPQEFRDAGGTMLTPSISPNNVKPWYHHHSESFTHPERLGVTDGSGFVMMTPPPPQMQQFHPHAHERVFHTSNSGGLGGAAVTSNMMDNAIPTEVTVGNSMENESLTSLSAYDEYSRQSSRSNLRAMAGAATSDGTGTAPTDAAIPPGAAYETGSSQNSGSPSKDNKHLDGKSASGGEVKAVDGSSKKRKPRAPPSTSFPIKLHKILSEPQYREYIAWLPHGRAWRVLKPKTFEEEVIPRFFRSDRYASFMRQVNGWGFRRITEGVDVNAYYHEMFLRGLPSLCAKMRRPCKGGPQHMLGSEFGDCPDFHKISLLAPLPDPEVFVPFVTPSPKAKRTKLALQNEHKDMDEGHEEEDDDDADDDEEIDDEVNNADCVPEVTEDVEDDPENLAAISEESEGTTSNMPAPKQLLVQQPMQYILKRDSTDKQTSQKSPSGPIAKTPQRSITATKRKSALKQSNPSADRPNTPSSLSNDSVLGSIPGQRSPMYVGSSSDDMLRMAYASSSVYDAAMMERSGVAGGDESQSVATSIASWAESEPDGQGGGLTSLWGGGSSLGEGLDRLGAMTPVGNNLLPNLGNPMGFAYAPAQIAYGTPGPTPYYEDYGGMMFMPYDYMADGAQSPFMVTAPPMTHASESMNAALSGGLSVADLCYLTQQNQVLLHQTQPQQHFHHDGDAR